MVIMLLTGIWSVSRSVWPDDGGLQLHALHVCHGLLQLLLEGGELVADGRTPCGAHQCADVEPDFGSRREVCVVRLSAAQHEERAAGVLPVVVLWEKTAGVL